MTRNECRGAFGGAYEEFRKLPEDDRTIDEFLGAVHVYYDDEDRAEYIEVSRMPGVRPTFDAIALLERQMRSPRATTGASGNERSSPRTAGSLAAEVSP